MKIQKTAKTAIVVALVCALGLSCFTGCVGTKKSQGTKAPTSQTQQVAPGNDQKTDTSKLAGDSKKTDTSKVAGDSKKTGDDKKKP